MYVLIIKWFVVLYMNLINWLVDYEIKLLLNVSKVDLVFIYFIIYINCPVILVINKNKFSNVKSFILILYNKISNFYFKYCHN